MEPQIQMSNKGKTRAEYFCKRSFLFYP